jgi:hypothetical protein
VTTAELATWLDEEYRRLNRLRVSRGYEEGYKNGKLQALAEIAAFIRSGCLPRHMADPAGTKHDAQLRLVGGGRGRGRR